MPWLILRIIKKAANAAFFECAIRVERNECRARFLEKDYLGGRFFFSVFASLFSSLFSGFLDSCCS
ncbi:hypothetical protein D9M70_452340 [compost metagenome]